MVPRSGTLEGYEMQSTDIEYHGIERDQLRCTLKTFEGDSKILERVYEADVPDSVCGAP